MATTIQEGQVGYYYASFLTEEEYKYFIFNYKEYQNKIDCYSRAKLLHYLAHSTFHGMQNFIDCFSWRQAKYPIDLNGAQKMIYWEKIALRKVGEQRENVTQEEVELEI